jgi:hypothetical protein
VGDAMGEVMEKKKEDVRDERGRKGIVASRLRSCPGLDLLASNLLRYP